MIKLLNRIRIKQKSKSVRIKVEVIRPKWARFIETEGVDYA